MCAIMRNFVHCVYCPIPESILIYMVLPQNCSLTVKTPRNLKRDSHLFSHKWKILRFRPRLNIVCRTFTSDKQWHFSKGVEMNLDTFCWKNKQTLGWSLRCIFFHFSSRLHEGRGAAVTVSGDVISFNTRNKKKLTHCCESFMSWWLEEKYTLEIALNVTVTHVPV